MRTTNIFALGLCFLTLLYSCSSDNANKINESTENTNMTANRNGGIASLIDLESVENAMDSINFQNKIVYSDYPENINFREGQFSETAIKNDLNNLFLKNGNVDFSIKVGTIYTDSIGTITGIGLYCYYENQDILEYELLQINRTSIQNMNGFPKTVNNFDFNDIRYISLNYIEKANMSTLMETLVQFSGNLIKDYNDLALERTTMSVIEPINRNKVAPPPFGSGGTRCSLAVPSCNNGTPGDMCYNYCHGGTDRYSQTISIIDDFAEENNIDIDFASLLNANKAYSLRDDILMKGGEGRKLIALYYIINRHFYETLDSPNVIIKTLETANNVSLVISRLKNDNYNGIIFDQDFIDEIENLLNTSAANSDSPEYKEAVPKLIQNLSEYKDLNRDQFLAKLDEY